MATSTLSSLSFDDDEDNDIVVTSARGCWRFSEGDTEPQTEKVVTDLPSINKGQGSLLVSNKDLPSINKGEGSLLVSNKDLPIPSINKGQGSNLINNKVKGNINFEVVKKEVAEDIIYNESPKDSSYSESPNVFYCTVKDTTTVASVGNIVATIKDKSNAEREYSANAMKKVRDLLKDSEINNDESECSNIQSDTIPVSQVQGEQIFSNTNTYTTLSSHVPDYTQQVEMPSPSRKHKVIETHSMVDPLSSSSSSVVAFTSEATSSNSQDNHGFKEVEPVEQVIKLIHTSDATLPYMCSACNMHSSNLGVMKQHIADHKKGVIRCPLLGLSKNVFICPFGNCDFSSPNYARVLTHLNRFHGREAQHLIKQITSASLPDAVAALNDPVSPLCKRESIWKEVALKKSKPMVQSKLYACSECDFKDYDYKIVIEHLQGHVDQNNLNKKQKTG